jgi:H+/Cl- antiporter ClcA
MSTPTPRRAVVWLLLGLGWGLLAWPYQLLSELGFQLQLRLWQLPGLARSAPRLPAALPPWSGPVLVFASTAALLALAWGPLAAGKGGGLAPVLALDRYSPSAAAADQQRWLHRLSLKAQLQRLPLMLLTHLGGLTVGIESPSATLGASALLALRQRCGPASVLGRLPLPLVAVVGGAAGLGAAFRSPLLGVVYGLEELGRRSGLPLVLPALLMAGSGTVLATGLGQPARLQGSSLGSLAPELWGWALLLTLAGALLGGVLVWLLIPLAALLQRQMGQRRWAMVLLLAAGLSGLALLSGGLSLNDGSLSLAALLQGQSGGGLPALLWRFPATLLSVAAGAPGGIMHDTMSLGALLVSPLHQLTDLDATALAQLAAIGATALFAAANGTPIFCAAFVFTLQGDAALLPWLLLVSAVSTSLSAPLRGCGWNDSQVEALR